MREYPQSAFKVKDSVLNSVDGYIELEKFMFEMNITLDHICRLDDGLIEPDELFESYLEEEYDENDNLIEKKEAGDLLDELTILLETFEKNFEIKYPAHGVFLQRVSDEAEGDITETFWELTDCIKEGVHDLSEQVNWTTYE